MMKIEAVIRPFRLREVMDALRDSGADGLTVSEVHARDLVPALKIEVVTPVDDVPLFVQTIGASARTGRAGDGMIFIYEIEDAVRIRNGQCGVAAL